VSDSPPSPHTKEEDVRVPADHRVGSNAVDPVPEFKAHTGNDLDNRSPPLPAQADESQMREQTDSGHDWLFGVSEPEQQELQTYRQNQKTHKRVHAETSHVPSKVQEQTGSFEPHWLSGKRDSGSVRELSDEVVQKSQVDAQEGRHVDHHEDSQESHSQKRPLPVVETSSAKPYYLRPIPGALDEPLQSVSDQQPIREPAPVDETAVLTPQPEEEPGSIQNIRLEGWLSSESQFQTQHSKKKHEHHKSKPHMDDDVESMEENRRKSERLEDWLSSKSQAQKLASKKHQSSKQRQPTMEDHVEPKKEQEKSERLQGWLAGQQRHAVGPKQELSDTGNSQLRKPWFYVKKDVAPERIQADAVFDDMPVDMVM